MQLWDDTRAMHLYWEWTLAGGPVGDRRLQWLPGHSWGGPLGLRRPLQLLSRVPVVAAAAVDGNAALQQALVVSSSTLHASSMTTLLECMGHNAAKGGG